MPHCVFLMRALRPPDIDTTCRLGLGYRDGPIERVSIASGLAYHYEVTTRSVQRPTARRPMPRPAAPSPKKGAEDDDAAPRRDNNS